MALIRQTDRRTGTACACEAEARWDPKRKQSRYGRRRLVGHVDPETGEVVPNRPTRASAPSPASRRESCNVFCQVVLNKWDCAVLIEPKHRLRLSVRPGPRPGPAGPGATPPQPGGGLLEHICPVEAFSIVPRRLAGGLVPRLPGGNVTERRILRDAGAADCAFP